MRRSLTSAALLMAALAVSACQTARNDAPQTGASAAPAPMAAEPAPTVREPAPQVTRRPPEPPINDDPRQLIGLDRGGVAALLGTPALIRREDPAEIWQYVAAGCVFDVVLYAAGSRFAVSYLEARDQTAAVQEPRPCLNKLLRARQATPVS